MFINIDNDYLLKNLLTPEENHNVGSLLNPEEGLMIGNMFFDLYQPYKHYKPKEVVVHSEKEKLLLKIQELSFAVNDLQLCLDLYPRDQRTYQLFASYVTELKKLCELYTEKYEPLMLEDDLKGKYTWEQGPWPWEVQDVQI